jgi:hypothetical protein
MITYRVVEHLKQQHWMALFLDFVIVVVGVFIGLQVNNWNEARQDQARTRDYLERIREDLEADIAGLARRKTMWASVQNHGGAALAYAEGGTLANGSAWETLLGYYQASQVWPYAPTAATYDEMRATGDLRLIRDKALRTALARYYLAGVRPVERLFEITPRYRERVRGLTPSRIQDVIWTHCTRTQDVDRFEMVACPAPISEAEARAVISGFRGDADLTADLRFWMTNMRVMTDFVALDEAMARELAARVEKEMR